VVKKNACKNRNVMLCWSFPWNPFATFCCFICKSRSFPDVCKYHQSPCLRDCPTLFCRWSLSEKSTIFTKCRSA